MATIAIVCGGKENQERGGGGRKKIVNIEGSQSGNPQYFMSEGEFICF